MVKRRDSSEENLSDYNLQKVISLLNAAEKPITKKAACELLNITYNTTRLQKLIDTYQEKHANFLKKCKEKSGTAATNQEIQMIVLGYLKDNIAIANIAKSIYRSDSFVRKVLQQLHIPIKFQGADYWHVPLIPEEALKEEYEIGEKCYSARYCALAEVRSWVMSPDNEFVYGIWLFDPDQPQSAYQPWWELARLDHLKSYGVML